MWRSSTARPSRLTAWARWSIASGPDLDTLRVRVAGDEWELDQRVNAEYERWRAQGISADGRKFGGRDPDPYEHPESPQGIANSTDPGSQKVKTPRGYMQGYNAEAVTTREQIVVAAEVTVTSSDSTHLAAMI